MGAGRGIALGALAISVFIFGLVTGLFIERLAREEYTLGETTSEGLLPGDRIKPEDIHVYGDHVRIDIPGVQWATFTPTGSMLPVLGSTVHGLQIPAEKTKIKIGDIISYHKDDKIISHRVIAIGQDAQGLYYETQGDSNAKPDDPVRPEQVDRVLLAALY